MTGAHRGGEKKRRHASSSIEGWTDVPGACFFPFNDRAISLPLPYGKISSISVAGGRTGGKEENPSMSQEGGATASHTPA